jgi:hypothetical protein
VGLCLFWVPEIASWQPRDLSYKDYAVTPDGPSLICIKFVMTLLSELTFAGCGSVHVVETQVVLTVRTLDGPAKSVRMKI